MAVAVSLVSTNSHNNTSVATLDTSNLAVASGETIVALLMVRNASITGVTASWNPTGANEALTEVASLVVNSAVTLKIFARLNCTAHASSFVRWDWTGNGACGANFLTLSGVDQTSLATSFVNVTTNSGNSTSPSVSITSQANNLTLDFVLSDNASFVLSAPTQTQRVLNNSMSLQVFGASSAAGAASNTHGWTISGTAQWGVIGIDIVATGQAGGGGGQTVTWVGYIG